MIDIEAKAAETLARIRELEATFRAVWDEEAARDVIACAFHDIRVDAMQEMRDTVLAKVTAP